MNKPMMSETWEEFLAALKAAGGSTDMQTSKTGRYPWLFHFCRDQASQLVDVVIYASTMDKERRRSGVVQSPPRDWSTKEKILADYRALKEAGGFFNDTHEALCSMVERQKR